MRVQAGGRNQHLAQLQTSFAPAGPKGPKGGKGVDEKKDRDGFEGATPNVMKGGSYNCLIGRPPEVVRKAVSHIVHSKNLDFLQLQEISQYRGALKAIKGYRLITFPGSKDHGESGILVKKELAAQYPRSIEAETGWTNVRGGPAQPRAAVTAKLAGWLRVASVHLPPAVDFGGGKAFGGAARVKSYQSLMGKLAHFANRLSERNPKLGILFGGDWNEGARTMGPGSPLWLARKTGMKTHTKGGIDWEMAKNALVTNMVRGKHYGSDHPLVTFTVTRPKNLRDD